MLDTPNYSKPPKKGLRLKAKKLSDNKYYIFITNYSLLLNLRNFLYLIHFSSSYAFI